MYARSMGLLTRRWLGGVQGVPRHAGVYHRTLSHHVPSSRLKRSWMVSDLRMDRNPRNLFYTRRMISTSLPMEKNTTFLLSDPGEGIAEVEVLKWYVEVGQTVEEFDTLAELQSDKATVEVKSPYDGVINKVHWKVGEMAQVGEPLLDFEVADDVETDSSESNENTEETTTETPPPSQEATAHDTSSTVHNEKPLATPAVRRIARENEINLSRVPGTGKKGRILVEDIQRFMEQGSEVPSASTPSPVQISIPPTQAQDRIVPVRGIRKAMVKTMTAAASIPHLGLGDEFDVTPLVQLRKEIKPVLEKENVKMSFMPFFLKAASLALLQYPELNSHINSDASEMIYKAAHNIGVAMDTPQGLLVPNIKNVEQRSLLDIARELHRLQELGKAGKLSMDDLSGGTFTLSNIGAITGTYASPILSVPEVAIGAIGKIRVLPRYAEDGSVKPTHLINFSWSADHRVIDGATVARFSKLLGEYLSSPGSMLINLK